jgi:hypothetical protein
VPGPLRGPSVGEENERSKPEMPPPLRGSEFCGIAVNQMAAASAEQLDEVEGDPEPELR